MRATAAPSRPAPFSLRRATPRDAAPLAVLGARTFRDAFGAHNRPEDMDAYVALAFGVRQQSAELADPRVTCVLAESAGDADPTSPPAVIGYAVVRQAADEVPDCVTGPDPVELARLYVDRPWHGRGVGDALMAAAIRAAHERDGRTLWLGVWEHNPRARAFYSRWGFAEVGEHAFLLGADRQRDLLLSRSV